MAFRPIRSAVEQRKGNLQQHEMVEHTVSLAVQRVLGESPQKSGIQIRYDTTAAILYLQSSSKSRSAELLLQSGELKAELTLAGVRCKGIVIR